MEADEHRVDFRLVVLAEPRETAAAAAGRPPCRFGGRRRGLLRHWRPHAGCRPVVDDGREVRLRDFFWAEPAEIRHAREADRVAPHWRICDDVGERLASLVDRLHVVVERNLLHEAPVADEPARAAAEGDHVHSRLRVRVVEVAFERIASPVRRGKLRPAMRGKPVARLRMAGEAFILAPVALLRKPPRKRHSRHDLERVEVDRVERGIEMRGLDVPLHPVGLRLAGQPVDEVRDERDAVAADLLDAGKALKRLLPRKAASEALAQLRLEALDAEREAVDARFEAGADALVVEREQPPLNRELAVGRDPETLV